MDENLSCRAVVDYNLVSTNMVSLRVDMNIGHTMGWNSALVPSHEATVILCRHSGYRMWKLLL
jgi:hypothetical protein